jgi:glycosyltransferase involved in cell wall biosynthesis
MKENPSITIVIPCLNEDKRLGKCLQAILKQTVLPEKIIFGDNESTDKSLEIAEIFEKKFEEKGVDFQILEIKKDPFLKQVFVREKIFEIVSTDLIGTIDVDTEICPDWVKVAKEEFALNEKIAVLAGYFEFRNTCWLEKMRFRLVFWNYRFKSNFIFWGCNAVFSKKYYDLVNGFGGLREMIERLELAHPYDDNFLSEKFKKIGQVKNSWKLKAYGERRGGAKREWQHMRDYFRIKYYVKKNWAKI